MSNPLHQTILPLDRDPSDEIVSWVQYAAQKLPVIDSMYLFHKREGKEGRILCAGAVLSESCKLGERQAIKKQLQTMSIDHGLDVLGLKEVLILDDIMGALVLDAGLKVYQKKALAE